MLINSTVREATHVKVRGAIKQIASKWGINPEGGFARPSQGGFGVWTTDGTRVSMMEADSYYRLVQDPKAPR